MAWHLTLSCLLRLPRLFVGTFFNFSVLFILNYYNKLLQVAAMLICGEVQHWVLPFGVPAALLCEAILHANNMRDIDQDRNAGISTLATVRVRVKRMSGPKTAVQSHRRLARGMYVSRCM